MRQNRKRGGLQVGTVSRCVLACCCLAAVGLAYVWQKNQIYHLGDDIKKREAAVWAAEKRVAMLAAQLAQLQSPALLESRCQQHGLGLVAPREQQMVRLVEPGPEWDARLAPSSASVAAVPAGPARKPTARTVAKR